jgi:TolB-like protein/tetratricopeptide (TPR) repeat protein
MRETERCLKHGAVKYRYVTSARDTIQGLNSVNETKVAGPMPEAIRAQLQRILESRVFSTARRPSQFLQFVVSRAIEGHAGEIKEYLIGVEVYNRDPSYDPRTDSIVRAEASRLRGKLREYYEGAGKNDPIRIELQKGSYTPVFRLNSGAGIPESNPVPEVLPKPKFRWQWGTAAIALLAGASVALAWWSIRGPGRVQSIAVMPPVNLGSDRNNNTLGDTVADEITKALVDSSDWKVVGRAPAVDQTGRDQMLEWLRKNLRADFVLTGNYRVGENSNVRLSLQIVNVEDGHLVWTQTYHQRLTLLADSHNEFVRGVVASVTEKTRSSGRAVRSPANARARASYSQARELWSKYTDQGYLESIPLFRQAIQADPGFAPAWAGLADANMQLAERWVEPVAERTADARSAARKAIALDDSNSEAHAALGWILLFKDWDFQEASRQLERAVALDPIRVFPNIYHSQALTILGNFGDAQAAVEAARARLPPIPEVLFQQGSVFFLDRQYEKLETLGRELVALEPNGTPGHWLVGLSLEQRGQVVKAIEEFKEGVKYGPQDHRILCALSHAYGLAGANAKALETMRLFIDPDVKEIKPRTRCFCAALTYASMGQKDKAFEWLERARAIRDGSFPFLQRDPRLDSLKSDSRFKPLADSLKNGGIL